jgi:hypothetical protein
MREVVGNEPLLNVVPTRFRCRQLRKVQYSSLYFRRRAGRAALSCKLGL